MNSALGFSDMTRRGFPHSDICVSTPACGSTQLIAANHVLRRLLTPRHPPSALSSLTTSLSGSRLLTAGSPAGSRPRFAFRECLACARPSGRADSANLAHATKKHVDTIFAPSSYYSIVNQRPVGLVRLELTTPRLSSVCSNQLSYRPSRSFKTDREERREFGIDLVVLGP